VGFKGEWCLPVAKNENKLLVSGVQQVIVGLMPYEKLVDAPGLDFTSCMFQQHRDNVDISVLTRPKGSAGFAVTGMGNTLGFGGLDDARRR